MDVFHCRGISLVAVLVCWLTASQLGTAQQCFQPALPFVDLQRNRNDPGILPNGRQAIVTSNRYQFQCCGDITAWQAYMQPGGGGHENGAYTIHFQVWRPSPTVDSDGGGCYSLVGENRFTSITLISRAVSETPDPTNIISVQPGDVVGYYVLSSRNNDDQGVQMDSGDDSINIYYNKDNGGNPISLGPNSCQVRAGDGGLLTESTSAAPQLSIDISTYACTSSQPVIMTTPSTPSPSPTSTQVPTQTPPPITTTTPVTPQQDTDQAMPTTRQQQEPEPTSPQQGTDPVQGPDQSTPTIIEPSNTDPVSAGPPDTSGSPVNAGLAGGLVVTVLVLIAVIVVVVVVLLMKRNDKTKRVTFVPAPAQLADLANPGYDYAPVKKPGERPLLTINSSQEAEYSSIYAEYSDPNAGLPGEYSDPDAHIYASAEFKVGTGKPPKPALPSRNQQGPDHESLSNPNYDLGAEYGAVYATGEDDESALYADPVIESYYKDYERTAFGSTGQIVPSQGDRKSKSATIKSDKESYSKLNFFEESSIYWSPGGTTSDIYNQLSSKKFRELTRSQIKILEHLGSGQFGKVSKGVWNVSGEAVTIAIKQLFPDASTTERVKLLQEAAIMGQFMNPNVVKLHGLVTLGDPLMVCIEYMENGDLRSYMETIDVSKGVVDGKDIKIFFLRATREVAAGMKYLSRKSFVHRDLAARNILLNSSLTCKIGDFGMARDLMDDTYYTAQAGSKIPVKWTAPEALLYKKYSSDSDVWSYAMVLFEIWSVGKKPYPTMSNQSVLRIIQSGYCNPPPPGCPRAMYKLMVDCWNPKHQCRPKFAEICNYLKQPVSKLLYWSPLDSSLSPSVHELGAPMDSSVKLYHDLQEKYIKK